MYQQLPVSVQHSKESPQNVYNHRRFRMNPAQAGFSRKLFGKCDNIDAL